MLTAAMAASWRRNWSSELDPLSEELAFSAATVAEWPYGVLLAHEHSLRAERARRFSLLQPQFDALSLDAVLAASQSDTAEAAALRDATPAVTP